MKFGKTVAACACALALCFGALVGCSSSGNEGSAPEPQPAPESQSAPEPQETAKAEDRVFTDMAGDEVIVQSDHDSVLTVNSVATQMVLMLGGPDAVATFGQGFDYSDGSLNKSMFPTMGERKTFTRDDITVENVAAVDPGLVVIDVPDSVKLLRDAGIPAAMMSVNDAASLLDATDMMGEALGADAASKAQAFRAFYEDMYNDVTGASANLPEDQKPGVIYLRSETTTCGDKTMPNEWIAAAGGRNVAAELGLTGARAEINAEALLQANPQVIVCERPELLDTITTSPTYAQLDAVVNGRVYVAPFGTAVWSMGGAEAALQLPWAGTIINPELYSEFDVDGLTVEFYELMYDYKLSDAELDTIFHR